MLMTGRTYSVTHRAISRREIPCKDGQRMDTTIAHFCPDFHLSKGKKLGKPCGRAVTQGTAV